jgi:aminoglycoside/choline kinase family phosphotransferase
MALENWPNTYDLFLANTLNGREYSVLPLAGDASARRYYRVICGQESHVLMVWDPFKDDGSYPFLSVQRHFANCGIQVPEVIGLSEELGVVLLEDLGDLTLERKFWENQDQNLAVPFYQQAIDEILKIHYLTGSPDPKKCTAFKIAFDQEKFVWELNYGREHLLEKLCGLKLTPNENSELTRIFTHIGALLDREPKFISHRDYHSRNLMLKHGKMRVIDFQDARLGPIQYDLVSLVHDSYVQMNDSVSEQILKYYLEAAAGLAPQPISHERFFEVFQVQMIQRCFKACGSFASFYNMRQDTRYLKYLPGTLKRVVKALEPFQEYKTMTRVLIDNGLLERNFENL